MSKQNTFPVDIGNGHTVNCELRPSRGRALRLSVSENGVWVAVPAATHASAVHRFVAKNKQWISKHYRQALERRQHKQTGLQHIPQQLNLLAVAEVWSLHHIKTEHALARLRTQRSDKTLLISGTLSPATVHALLRRWLRRYAHIHLPPWVAQLARHTGLTPQDVKIRNQKTRHGSCSTLGSINLNQQLLFYPSELVTNVILHELCHLRHRNHSQQFWSLLARYDPDYKQHNRQIRNYEKQIPAWAQEPARRPSR